VKGARVGFTAPAYPGETFFGVVSRIAHSLDPKTRTMPVELDVANRGDRLAAGMYPAVQWPVRSARKMLLVPPTAIVTTSERVFVIRVRDGAAEWVDVKKGPPQGDLVEVLGPLAEGDTVVRRGSDEIRPGARVK
jgi:membrane fusion protein (multidrug efflux system)